MSDIEESPSPVRKTRSGRAVKTPSKPKSTPAKSLGRKTRKKMVVMEVEVTDDEETEQSESCEPALKKSKLEEDKILEISDTEGTDENSKSEDALLTSGDEAEKKNHSTELIMNDIAMLEEIMHTNEKITEKVQESENESKIKEAEAEKLLINEPEEEENKVEESSTAITLADEEKKENGVQQDENQVVEDKKALEEKCSEQSLEESKVEKVLDAKISAEREENKEEKQEAGEKKDQEKAGEKKDQEEAGEKKDQEEAGEKKDQEEVAGEKKDQEEAGEKKDQEEAGEKKDQEEVGIKKDQEEAGEKKDQVTNQNGEPEAENISDDELPGVPVVKVPETEEVSDEELPGPKRAELPADTEVVSEDELPSTKKDADEEDSVPAVKKDTGKRKLSEGDYDPTSPTSETEAPPKKSKEDKEEKDKEGGEAAKSAKPKKLPELDKYWKAVNDDPTDFTGWTYLLQYVDQENDMEAAREAYDAFLSHYPYCYGYWRKYADYEKRKGNKKKCEEVFERGLKAIPLSVDLWIHYLTYVKSTRGEDEEYVRSQFERAVLACGLEFRSDRLWDSYVKWETDGKRLQKVTGLFDRLLTTPTQGYTTHFDNFQEHVSSNPPNKILEVDEFMALRKEVRSILKNDEKAADNADLPPGDEDSKLYTSEEETKSIRERIVSIRRKLLKNTVNAVTSRWNYEEGIKRPYFHVKPLERCQLKNWQEYLDYEIEKADRVRIIVLFERCLIACALYEEFWLKFVHYLESLEDPEVQPKIRDVYERACTIHHLKKPNLHLQWAAFEEANGNVNRAAEILVNLEKQVPNVLQVAYRRINLERRRSEFEKCAQLFEHYISNSKNKMISSNIAIKYSRFCLKVLKDFDKAQEALKAAIAKDPNNPRLYLQLIDLTLQKDDVKEEDVSAVIEEFLEKESADPDQKALFAQRKLEYLEDFGSGIKTVQAAHEQFQKYQKLSKEAASKKKEAKSDSTVSTTGKKDKPAPSSTSQSQSYNNYNYGNSSNQPPYNYSGSQQGQYSYPQYGQGGEQYQYQNWQYPQGGAYGGYNQWGGYTGGYGY